MQVPYEYQLAVADYWEGRPTMEPNVWVPALPLQMTVAAPASNTDLVVSSGGQQELKLVEEESTEYQYEWSNPIEDFEKAAQAFEDDLEKMQMKMHLFPPSMDDQELTKYSKPKVVSIGPYHHGTTAAIKQMESTKYAAACHFIKESDRSVEEVYGAVFAVAGQARGYYDADRLRDLSDNDFKPMMFYDGCFLLQYMLFMCRDNNDEDHPIAEVNPSLRDAFSSIELSIFSDIVLLENQLPWVVVEKLKEFMPKPGLDMETFIGRVKQCLQTRRHRKFDPPILDKNYKPPHLLGLLRFYIVRSTDSSSTADQGSDSEEGLSDNAKKVSMSVSVIELTEMGIRLTADKSTAEINKMRITKGFFTGKLFLPPVSLDDANARFLVNMAAFELCVTPDFGVVDDTLSTVCAYLCLLGMVTDNDTDVQELRKKLILQGGGGLTNEDALKLFTGLEKHLRPGNCYYNTIVAIENYRSRRRLWIKVYRFGYRNRTIIIAVLSAIAGLAGFLGTLKSFQ